MSDLNCLRPVRWPGDPRPAVVRFHTVGRCTAASGERRNSMFNRRSWPAAGVLAGVVALSLTAVAPAQAATGQAGGAAQATTAKATSAAGVASASAYWT